MPLGLPFDGRGRRFGGWLGTCGRCARWVAACCPHTGPGAAPHLRRVASSFSPNPLGFLALLQLYTESTDGSLPRPLSSQHNINMLPLIVASDFTLAAAVHRVHRRLVHRGQGVGAGEALPGCRPRFWQLAGGHLRWMFGAVGGSGRGREVRWRGRQGFRGTWLDRG